jgi:hypothetical protein
MVTRLSMNRAIVLALGLTLCLSGHGLAASSETQRLYLSGLDMDHTVPWHFQCTSGANSGFWTNLPVPSQWDVQGFGTLNYFRDATNAFNEHGLYEHAFTVPADWTGRRVFLVFEGVMTDTRAKLNGESVGPVHQGGFYQFKYEVTAQIKFGATNRLEVDVARHSANDSVNHAERNADYWVFAGIYRPVYLEAVPPAFIERVAVDARADGDFTANVFLNEAPDDASVEAQIQTLSGQPVGAPFRAAITDATETLTLRTQIPNPQTWSAETPNLYAVRLQLKRGEAVLHTYHQRFGFRTMEVRAGDGFYVNGHRVILKGVNRHSFWPDSGRCLSEAVHRLDIETIKDLNANAVRMSHYPPDAQFLDLCDELGLYVLDELGGWQHSYDTQVGTKRLQEMLARDVNRPCILFWDNGNEGGWNTNLDRLFGQLDPQQRHVLHPWQSFDGINTAHYLPYDRAVIAATGTASSGSIKSKGGTETSVPLIYLPTEFLHGLFDGGAGAGLEDYWRMMMSHPNCGGGFIWALLDEAVKRPVTGELDTAGNQAPDGIVGPYRQREGSFYTIKQVWSPITIERQSENTFKVENHYSFTDSRQCSFTWQWRQLPAPGTPGTNFTVLAEVSPALPSIPAGQDGEFIVQLPAAPATADALALRVADPGGRELWTWVWPTERVSAPVLQAKLASARGAPVTAQSDQQTIQLQCGGLRVAISKASGRLERVELNGQLISLHNGPRLAVGESVLKAIHLDRSGDSCVVTANYAGDLKQVRWQLEADGTLDCRYRYKATDKQNYFGVLFDYPENLVRAKRWLGNGPYRVWKNRLAGGTFNVWANTYNNTITGYREWIYPEFKGCFANVRWLQLTTSEGVFTVVPEQVPYLQVLTPDLPPKKLLGHAFADLPKCGLGFLDAIPPIGSKFSGAETTGPQGQKSLGQGEYSGHVAFHFGN